MTKRAWRRRARSAVAGLCLLAVVGCDSPEPWRSDLVSRSLSGSDGGNGPSSGFAASPDGRLIAFTSLANDLVPQDLRPTDNVHLLDRATGEISLVSVSPDGMSGGSSTSSIGEGAFNADGSMLVFESYATNIGPFVPDSNSSESNAHEGQDIFVRDLGSGTTDLVSVNLPGTGSGNSDSLEPVFSPDGTGVAFRSFASDLTTVPTTRGDDISDVYVRDLTTGVTTLVSVDVPGTGGGNASRPDRCSAPTARRLRS